MNNKPYTDQTQSLIDRAFVFFFFFSQGLPTNNKGAAELTKTLRTFQAKDDDSIQRLRFLMKTSHHNYSY